MATVMDARRTFRVFGFCGFIGVLVDVDHAAALLLWQYVNSSIIEGHLFHTSLFIITGLTICGVCTYLGRLYHKPVLVSVGAATLIIMLSVLIYSPWVVWSWSR